MTRRSRCGLVDVVQKGCNSNNSSNDGDDEQNKDDMNSSDLDRALVGGGGRVGDASLYY
jgi:hypothetical protein